MNEQMPWSTGQSRQIAWSANPALVAVGWTFAALAAVWLTVTTDPAGRVIAAVTALVLGFAALFGTVARPRLVAGPMGLTLRGLFRTQQWPWAEVGTRLVHTQRLGRRVAVLEIEITQGEAERLFVLGRLDLGTDPEEVAAQLTELRGLA
ncbi:PH domain-containing protein [Crossiella sp. SN42]|uniref:PH domain-containing protein n=1 Tax=Crossiella sp. SN42 TaxID=2944808 RepID=UPI00207CBC98|nr:PH domain-containing protein [Crossiella sp. SN42]MCO1581377.1 PH domain-containing protein [Crossiella sp. SN42]